MKSNEKRMPKDVDELKQFMIKRGKKFLKK